MSDILNLAEKLPAPRLLWAGRTRSNPIPGDATALFWREDYIHSRALYRRAEMGSPSYREPLAVLTDEQVTREEGDAIWFSRTYATVPAARDEPSNIAFQFPGMTTGDWLLRAPFTRNVLARVRYDYFQTSDPFGNVNAANRIPLLQAFAVYGADGHLTEYLGDLTSPTVRAYIAKIKAGEDIVARESELARYAGDIWERRTTYTRAR